MAYASWSVTFGEQPSAAKWNILGTNDASFNDGTGIGTNAIAAASLSTSAIKLGYSALTADVGTSGTSNTEATGLATTVTIPAGGRSVLILFSGWVQPSSTNNTNVTIWDGTVGSGTILATSLTSSPAGGSVGQVSMNVVVTPAAGAKTYRVSIQTSTSASSLRSKASGFSVGDIGATTLTVLAI